MFNAGISFNIGHWTLDIGHWTLNIDTRRILRGEADPFNGEYNLYSPDRKDSTST